SRWQPNCRQSNSATASNRAPKRMANTALEPVRAANRRRASRFEMERRNCTMSMQEQREIRVTRNILSMAPANLSECQSRQMSASLTLQDSARTAALRRELARMWAAFGTFEHVALGYLCLSSALVAIFSRNLSHPWKLVGVNVMVASIIFLLCAIGLRSEEYAQHHG